MEVAGMALCRMLRGYSGQKGEGAWVVGFNEGR